MEKTHPGGMETDFETPRINVHPLKHASGFLPIAMSLAALVLVVGRIALFGMVHEADEGAAAHSFQLLMVGQLPVVAFFALTWLRRDPRRAWWVLLLQAGAAGAALAPVIYFKF